MVKRAYGAAPNVLSDRWDMLACTPAVAFALVLVREVVEGFEGKAEAVRLHSDGAAEGLVNLSDGQQVIPSMSDMQTTRTK